MAPKGIQVEENFETNSKGVEIFWKSWLPREGTATKAALFFCHGYGDTCTFFFEGIAKRIAAAGYAVYAMDYPGFGLSYGLHGYIASFDGMVDYVIEQYARIRGSRAMLIAPVLSDKRGVGAEVKTPKSSSSHRSHVISAVKDAMVLNSASALERETTVCFLVFQAIKEEPRKTQ